MADEIEALFREVDANNNGKISLTELGEMFKKLEISLTPEDVKSIVVKYDINLSCDIDLEEFRKLISDVFDANSAYESAVEIFTDFDKNGDNTLTYDEIREACGKLELGAKEIEDLIVKLDENGDGYVTFDEFAKAYACGA